MFKLFKDTFKIAGEGIILGVPLVLFMCIISLYINYSKEVVDTVPEMVLSAVTMLFMSSAFFAGWFYMVKKCVEFSKKDFILDKDKSTESLKLIQTLSVGVGKYFLTYVGVSLMFVGIALLMAFILYMASVPFINSMHFTISQMSMAINSPQDTQAFLNGLPPEQLIILFKLNLLLMGITSLFSFLMMLWMPEIIYSKRNPLIALFTSIKKIFVKFGKSITLFLYITILNFLISFLGTFAFVNPVTYMIMMLVYFYFIVYIVVLLFSYYDKEFNEQIAEQRIETESDSDSRGNG